MTPQQFTAYVLCLLMPLSAGVPLTAPLWDGIHWLYVTPTIEPADVPAFLLVVLTILEPRYAHFERHRPSFAHLLAALAGLGLLSAAGSRAPQLALYFTLRWAFAGGVCWALFEADLKARSLATALLLGLTLQAAIAFGQAIHQGPLGLPGELASAPNAFGASVIKMGDHLWLRGYGLTFHPNVLGGFMVAGMVLALPLLDRLWVAPALWLMGLALLATFSRSAFIAAAIVLPITAFWLWRLVQRLRRGLILTFAAGVCVVAVAGWMWRAPIAARLGATTSLPASATFWGTLLESLQQDNRLQLDGMALQTLAAHPLLGIGAGNSPMAMQAEGVQPHYPHNVALMLATEVGIGGALFWLALPVVAVRRLRNHPAAASLPWLVAGVASLAALQIIALLDCYPWSLNSGRMLTITVLALIEIASRGVTSTAPLR
ncbi:MAG: O-antigen ligase family protein [Deltaproteobacteria bacterium]|nr:O-antigen ligase family protein [Deltaproteobacteria bacterium]